MRRGDAHVLLQCLLLPGNSRVYVRINYWLNGSMTKNVKEGLGAGNAGLRPVCLSHLRCDWKISLYPKKRIYKEHLHPSQLFTSSAHKSATRYGSVCPRKSLMHPFKYFEFSILQNIENITCLIFFFIILRSVRA